jgi:hypothetical protein
MAAKKQVYAEPKLYVACAYAGCKDDANMRVKRPTGWANVCYAHYVHVAQVQADDFCQIHGLDTPEKCRKFLVGKKPFKSFSEAA